MLTPIACIYVARTVIEEEHLFDCHLSEVISNLPTKKVPLEDLEED